MITVIIKCTLSLCRRSDSPKQESVMCTQVSSEYQRTRSLESAQTRSTLYQLCDGIGSPSQRNQTTTILDSGHLRIGFRPPLYWIQATTVLGFRPPPYRIRATTVLDSGHRGMESSCQHITGQHRIGNITTEF